MMGFFRRDLSLQAVNGGFYVCFVLAFCVLAAFSDFNASFISLYLVVFSGTSIMGLFSYDEANHWEAYAAAVPNGRKAMVDARYLIALLLGAVVFLLQLLLGVLNRSDQLAAALLYGGGLLLYAAIVLPVAYRFGGTKSRIIMVVAIAAFSGLFAIGSVSLGMSSDNTSLVSLPFLPGLFPLVAALILAVSHRISRAIVASKEL